MPPGAGGRGPPDGGVDPAVGAAHQLAALVPPLRFAVRDGFAALQRLSAFEELLRGAVARARAAGAPDSAALRALAADADGFDRLATPEKKRALARIAGNLSALIPVPDELRELAARGRVVEARGRPSTSTPALGPSPRPSPSSRERGPSPAASSGNTSTTGHTIPSPPAGERARERGPSPAASSDNTSTTGHTIPSPPAGERARVRGPASPALPNLAPWDAAEPIDLGSANQAAPLVPPEPKDAAEREARRARLRARLSDLPRVHPAPRSLLEERGHVTVEQSLFFWPKSYQDRTHTRRIADLRVGEEGIGVGQVRGTRASRMRSGRPMLKVEVADASGRMDLVFFNPPPWRLRQFASGETLLVSGKVTEGFGGRRTPP